MAIYNWSADMMEKFIGECINKGSYTYDISSAQITEILLSDKEESLIYEKRKASSDELNENMKEAQLHIGAAHIRVKDTVKDFLEKVLCGGLLDSIIYLAVAKSLVVSGLSITKDVILFLKDFITEYIVYMSTEDYNVYLRILREVKRKKNSFTADDIDEIFDFSSADEIDKEKLQDILKRMVDKGVLNYRADTQRYSVNY